MSRFYTRVLLSCLCLTFGCDDHAGGPRIAAPDTGVETDLGYDSTVIDADVDAAPFYGIAAYVELSITPRKALYNRDETPQVTAIVYDRIGQALENYPIRFDTRPVESATVDESGNVTFSREGAGAVRGCATPDLCGRVSFFVDDAPPLLEVISPERGAYLSGAPTILVEGRTDSGGAVEVYLNDQALEVDEEGYFQANIAANFGLNLVDIIADDGVRRPATRSVREVVWAPEILPRAGSVFVLEHAARMRVSQSALDAQNEVNAPDANPLLSNSLSELLEQVFTRIDAMSLVDDPQLVDSDIATLRLVDVLPGVPSMEVLFVEGGLELFFSVDGLSIELAGDATITGEPFSLDGLVTVDASAFVQVTINEGASGSFNLGIGEYGASIERINALMENETVQIVLEGAETIVGTPLRNFLEQYLDDLVQEELPALIEVGLDSVFEPLQGLSIEVDEGGTLGTGRVDFSLVSATPRVVAGEGLYFDISGELTEPADIQPRHDTPGIPSFNAAEAPAWPVNAAVAIALRLSTLNFLLDSMWRQGLLSMDLTPEIPEGLQLLISSARIEARLPPLLVPSPVGAPDELIFQLGELDLVIESPTRSEADIYVASIRAGFYVDFSDGELTLGLSGETTDIRFELLQAQDGRPILPPSTLAGFVGDNLWPQIESNLGEVLSVDIESVRIDTESIRSLVPSFDYIAVLPMFSDLPKAIDGWLVGGASTDLELHLNP